MLQPYKHVLCQRGIPGLFVANLFVVIAIGMLPLGLLLLVRSATGSFALAGVAAATLAGGNAVGLLVQGRLIDAFGQSRVLAIAAFLCTAALLALSLALEFRGPSTLAIPLCGIAGVSIPASTSGLRVLLPSLISDPPTRGSAYALLGVSFQLGLIIGPLIVSVLLLAGPGAPVPIAAVFAGGGGLVFAFSRATRQFRPEAKIGDTAKGAISRGVWVLVCAGAISGLAGGIVVVAIPALTVAHGVPALAGVIFAARATGDFAGGLIYGARSWRTPIVRRLMVAQWLAAGVVVAMVIPVGQPASLVVLEFLFGIVAATATTATSAILDDITESGALTRSYTTIVAGALLGNSAGNLIGGLLGERLLPGMMFAIAAAGAIAVATWTTTMRTALTRRRVEASVELGNAR